MEVSLRIHVCSLHLYIFKKHLRTSNSSIKVNNLIHFSSKTPPQMNLWSVFKFLEDLRLRTSHYKYQDKIDTQAGRIYQNKAKA